MTEREIYGLEERSIGCRIRFFNSLINMLTLVREYQSELGRGRIYHVCGCTVDVCDAEIGNPVHIFGDKNRIPRAVSKLERVSEYKLIRHS